MTSFLRLRFDCHVSQDEKIVFLCVCFLKKKTLTLYKIFCDFLVCSFLEAITLIKILPIQRQTPRQHFKSCLDALELSSRCFFFVQSKSNQKGKQSHVYSSKADQRKNLFKIYKSKLCISKTFHLVHILSE